MRCVWQAYLNILPSWIRMQMDKDAEENLQEMRLRIGESPMLMERARKRFLQGTVFLKDIQFVINVVSQYSPWTSGTVSQGFLTAQGGHRIGICGQASQHQNGIIDPSSLCIRIARDFPGIAGSAAEVSGSVLILGPPGSGKTTFLRDLIRQKSNKTGKTISVIDEKSELFPAFQGNCCFAKGGSTDIMSGCSKTYGIETVLRNMGPEMIAVDEITAQEDCHALIQSGWCGVELLATVHASSLEDLKHRPIYKPLIDTGLFRNFIILKPDKSWKLERE